jgi:sensor histidine kinase YesM
MTEPTTLTAIHYLGAAILVLIVLLGLACCWAYDAFERGSSMRRAELSQLRAGMKSANRNNNDLRRETVSLKNQLERSKENAAQALEQQQLHHDHELQTLRAQFTPLSERDITTIQQMAEKLNLAASALHATGSFKDSREAKNLASSGFRIASDLTRARALQEAA